MKLTFLGDIMAEPPVLKAAKRKDGTYDFTDVFAYVKPLLSKSDFVVGNLETPLAGPEAKYTQEHYVFNAPDSYVDACKAAGIGMLSTANNHSFDRGYAGLERTVRVMEEKGMGHHGTSLPGKERPEAFYTTLRDTKIGIIAYTYGTNYSEVSNPFLAEGDYAGTVNLLHHQSCPTYLPGVFRDPDWVDKLFPRMYREPRGRLKKLLGMCATYPRSDDRIVEEKTAPFIEQMQEDIRKAKTKADVVIFYPHVGGQFNLKPGYFTQYVVEKALEAGADAVVASHSHCPQLITRKGEVPVAYSLGNFNMSPRSSLAYPEHLSHYGLALHLYIEDRRIQKVRFSMLQNYEKPGTQVSAYPVDALYAALPEGRQREQLLKDVKKLYGVATGKVLRGELIREEYEL